MVNEKNETIFDVRLMPGYSVRMNRTTTNKSQQEHVQGSIVGNGKVTYSRA